MKDLFAPRDLCMKIINKGFDHSDCLAKWSVMEYPINEMGDKFKGKLYGKVGNVYVPMLNTAEDWDKLEQRVKSLEASLLDVVEKSCKSVKQLEEDKKSLGSQIIELREENEKFKKERLDEIVSAVQYGFDYMKDSQNDGISVPAGNILQWLMAKDGLLHVPEEYKEYLKLNKQ